MEVAAVQFAILLCILSTCQGHDSCLSGFSPKDRSGSNFKLCGKYRKNGCCDEAEEEAVFNAYIDVTKSLEISRRCKKLVGEIFCQKCSPQSAHLYEGGVFAEQRFPNLCPSFCSNLRKECGDVAAIFGEDICSTAKAKSADVCYPDTDAGEVRISTKNIREEDCVSVCFQTILSEMPNIVGGAFPPDDENRLFLLQQDGVVWELDSNRNKLSKPFLDMTQKVYRNERVKFEERGLLSMVFHPKFSENKLFYIFYHPAGKDIISRIAKMKVFSTEGPMIVDESSEEIILEFSKTKANHNGGQLLFGHDGYLYISTGDGGGQGDHHGLHGNGQSLTTFHGKILRIDVDTPNGYKIPPDNPFARSEGDKLKEIYAYGFRNPWRMTLDKVTGDIYIGDVGQGSIEEVNVLVKGGNYGWRAYEGESCYDSEICSSVEDDSLQKPIYSYQHSKDTRAIIGGYLYRGKAIPSLEGKYVFGDWYNSRNLWALEDLNGDIVNKSLCAKKEHCPEDNWFSDERNQLFAFTEDQEGEIYVITGKTAKISNKDCVVWKLIPAQDS